MKHNRKSCGMTLVEMLIVIAIIVILAGITVSTATWVQNRAKDDLAKGTIDIVVAGIEEFGSYGYQYEEPNYSPLKFPLDCNGLYESDVEAVLKSALLGAPDVDISGGTCDPNYSGSAVLYFLLSRVPESRKALEKIDKSLITNLDKSKQPMTITITTSGGVNEYPFCRIVDPWGKSLRYEYYKRDETTGKLTDVKNFPVITSAGQDKKFNTADDISSK